MVSLSEKAKGKQRAIEQPDPLDNRPSLSAQRTITIRFADGTPDLQLVIEVEDTVRRVKQKIRESRPQIARRRLRLIHSGRIFTNDVKLLEYFQASEKRQRRSTETQDDKVKGKQKEILDTREADDRSSQASIPLWLHCSVGAEMKSNEDDDDRIQETQIKPLRGFDRLAAAGFSAEDIANFRRTFHSRSGVNYLDAEPLGDDEDYEEHARALEEQWIESLGGADSPISPSSASTTLLQGLLAGFFFPLIPFFFFHEARPPVFWEDGRAQEAPSSVVFSRRMQMALVLGFILNVTFGMWRYVLGS